MISLADYIGPWGNSPDWTSARQANAEKLLAAVNVLMGLAESDGVRFPTNVLTHSQISGAKYGGFRPQDCPQGAPHSNHKEGLAVDLFDPNGEIDAYCMAHLDKLELCGIWIEAPDSTPHWSHWSCVPPHSGNRVFIP